MDEFKPEDELRPDPSDRRAGRSRKAVDQDNEPKINIDDVDFDEDDDRRSPRRRQAEEAPELYQADDEEMQEDEEAVRRSRKRQYAAQPKGTSHQRIMMGVGILVLLLIVIGIGSALKSPSGPATANENNGSAEKSIDISGHADNGNFQTPGTNPDANTGQPLVNAGNNMPAGQNSAVPYNSQSVVTNDQDISLPPVAQTPTQSAPAGNTPNPQNRVELQGDLGNNLSSPAVNDSMQMVATSSLPTQPATVAAVGSRGDTAVNTRQSVREEPHREVSRLAVRSEPKTQPARKAEPQTTKTAPLAPKLAETKTLPAKASEPKAVAPKHTETASATSVAAAAPKTSAATPATAATPVTRSASSHAAPATTGAGSIGNVSALQSAPGSNYTLQLSSSSNINNLNSWAKKENLQNYVVYQTKRNGQPWYVLVTGVYGSRDEARKAVASLPAEVQAKNPWTKPIHQVQADLKQ